MRHTGNRALRIVTVFTIFAMVFPVMAQQDPIARILKSLGDVKLQRISDADFITEVTAAMEIFDGDALRAGEDGFTTLLFLDDKTLLKIKAGTQIQIIESEGVRTVSLDYGTLRSKLPSPLKDFRLETPVSVASVKGTDFWMISDPNAGVDRAYGVDGVVEVLNRLSGAIQNLTAGTMMISTQAGLLTPPIPVAEDEFPYDPEEGTGDTETGEAPGEGEATGESETVAEGAAESVAIDATPIETPEMAEEAGEDEEGPPEESGGGGPGMGLGLGSVTIDGQVYYQIALRPEFKIWKIGVGLDLVGYMDAEGNFRKDEWDNPSDYLDKIYYLRYGTEEDPFFMRIGAMPTVQYGFGGLMSGYSNMTEYPQVRRVGFEIGGKVRDNVRVKGFTADLKELSNGGGLIGLRAEYKLSKAIPLTLGLNVVSDLNQYGGLKDSDGDNRPDMVDDFPQDDAYWLDSDGDGRADNAADEYDIDGDGWTDNAPNPDDNNDPDGISAKPDPFNLKDNARSITGFSVDLSYPLINTGAFSLIAYTEWAMLTYADELSVLTEDGTKVSAASGSGLIGPGFRSQILKFLNVSFEYRMTSALFQPGFFNNTYDFERARFVVGESGMDAQTKDQATINNPYSLSGFFGSASADLFGLVTFGAAYQSLSPSTADSSALNSNSFIANLSINTDPIPKISEARAYYIRTNDADPFNFAEPSPNTTMGYRFAYEMAPGVNLVYNMQESYRDLNGDGKIDKDADGEVVRLISFETAFNF